MKRVRYLTYAYRPEKSRFKHGYWVSFRKGQDLTTPTYTEITPAEVLEMIAFPTRTSVRWVLRICDVDNGDSPGFTISGQPSPSTRMVRITQVWRGPQRPEDLLTTEQAIELWLAHANMMYSKGTR